MNDNDNIAEIADKLCTTSYFCSTEDWDSCNQKDDEYCHRCRKVAERLYNAGYRKQRTGKWIERIKKSKNVKGIDISYSLYFCSECGYQIGPINCYHTYCSGCGAKMERSLDELLKGEEK